SELTAYGRDEIRFRADHPDSPLLEYFGPSPIWERRREWSRCGARRKCGEGLSGVLSGLFHGEVKAAGRKMEQAVRFCPAAVLGTDWMRLRARLAVARAMLLLYVLYPTKRG